MCMCFQLYEYCENIVDTFNQDAPLLLLIRLLLTNGFQSREKIIYIYLLSHSSR